MSESQNLELKPGVWIDCRRALFLEQARVLCLADLHLGYLWAHRIAGQMLPVKEDDTATRLQDLCQSYDPVRVVVLGDIVHRAVPTPQIRDELTSFLRLVSVCSRVELIAGNHDRALAKLLPSHVPLHSQVQVGSYVLVHGDLPVVAQSDSVVVMGHEHPAVSLGDGVRGARFPCYLAGPRLIVLPAFSMWAAGSDVRRGVFLSETVNQAELRTAVAIMGNKLLKIPFSVLWKNGGERGIRTPGGV